jgi:glycerol uptake facilitator-like aquaporin
MSTGRWLSEQFLSGDIARLLPIAFGFGISIMFLAFSIGHITGGHMNPGVSLMMVFKRQMSWTKMLCYWLAQFAGALLGAALAWGGTSGTTNAENAYGDVYVGRPPLGLGANTLDPAISAGNGFLLEFMGSFVFYFVIAQTALDERGIAKTNFPAIPIGFSLIVVHLSLIPFTGCGALQTVCTAG